MSDIGPPPVPDQYKVYNSYATDPKYSRYFTYTWLCALVLAVVFSGSITTLIRSLQSGQFFRGWYIDESLSSTHRLSLLDRTFYRALSKTEDTCRPRPVEENRHKVLKAGGIVKILLRVDDVLASAGRLIPTVMGGGGAEIVYRIIGQIMYLGILLLFVLKDAQLSTNPNRLGFMTLAQLTPLFLLSTKNNPLAFILTTSYEKLNWAHRWLGRTIWLTGTCHGVIWAYKHGRQYTLSNQKTRWGLAAYTFLCFSALTSIKPIRSRCYTMFWIAHVVSIVGFFTAIAYHTPYASPWIYPPIALYAFDLCIRLVKIRFKDAVLIPLEGMTLIHIPHATHGWLPGQHIYLRLLTSSRSVFEPGHPFTILSPPRRLSQTGNVPNGEIDGILLLAGCSGDWTRSVHSLARSNHPDQTTSSVSENWEKESESGVWVNVMIDGPYGSFGARYISGAEAEIVICIAGGSGVSFLIAIAEEIREGWADHRECSGSSIRVVELVWVVQSLATYKSLEPLLSSLLSPQMRLSVYLTRSPMPTSDQDSATVEPFTTLHFTKPNLGATLEVLINEHAPISGVSIRACGSERLVHQVERSVGSLDRASKTRVGGISFSKEAFGV